MHAPISLFTQDKFYTSTGVIFRSKLPRKNGKKKKTRRKENILAPTFPPPPKKKNQGKKRGDCTAKMFQ